MPNFVSRGLPIKRPVSKQDPEYVKGLKEEAQKKLKEELNKGKSKSSPKLEVTKKETFKKEEKKSSEKKK